MLSDAGRPVKHNMLNTQLRQQDGQGEACWPRANDRNRPMLTCTWERVSDLQRCSLQALSGWRKTESTHQPQMR